MAATPKRHVDDNTHLTGASGAVRRQAGAADAPALRPPRQLRSEENLAKMILAGRGLIEQHRNFDLVLINDVIRIAGTSTGAFYGRFKDKDAFIASVLDAAFAEMKVDADNAFRDEAAWAQGSAAELTARIVEYYVDMCRRNQGMFKAVLRHFAALDPDANPMRWLNRHIQGMVAPKLAQRIKTPTREGAESEVRIVLQMVVGTLTFILITDPGPMRFEGNVLEAKLTAMMQRYLLLE